MSNSSGNTGPQDSCGCFQAMDVLDIRHEVKTWFEGTEQAGCRPVGKQGLQGRKKPSSHLKLPRIYIRYPRIYIPWGPTGLRDIKSLKGRCFQGTSLPWVTGPSGPRLTLTWRSGLFNDSHFPLQVRGLDPVTRFCQQNEPKACLMLLLLLLFDHKVVFDSLATPWTIQPTGLLC